MVAMRVSGGIGSLVAMTIPPVDGVGQHAQVRLNQLDFVIQVIKPVNDTIRLHYWISQGCLTRSTNVGADRVGPAVA